MQGQIQAVDSRTGQYGTMWRVQINGQWMGAGKAPPPPAGTFVNYDAVVNAKGYTDAKNITPVQGAPQGQPAPQYAPNAPNRPGQGGYAKKPFTGAKSQEEKDYWNKRDAKEEVKDKHYQARWALSQGLEFALKSAQAGYVKLAGKSPEDHREQVLVLGFELAGKFLEEANRMASGNPQVPEPAAEPAEVEEDGDGWEE